MPARLTEAPACVANLSAQNLRINSSLAGDNV